MSLELMRSDLGDGGWSIHRRDRSVDEYDDPVRAWPIVLSGESDVDADSGWTRPNANDWAQARAIARRAERKAATP